MRMKHIQNCSNEMHHVQPQESSGCSSWLTQSQATTHKAHFLVGHLRVAFKMGSPGIKTQCLGFIKARHSRIRHHATFAAAFKQTPGATNSAENNIIRITITAIFSRPRALVFYFCVAMRLSRDQRTIDGGSQLSV